jgi:hypothetical protein
MYDKTPKEGTAMPARKLELVREALRFYVETRTSLGIVHPPSEVRRALEEDLHRRVARKRKTKRIRS